MQEQRAGTVRVAVVGAMGKGKSHAKSLASEVRGGKLSAIVDHNPEAQQIAREFDVPFFTSTEALIAGKCCDAVLCAVPHPAHRAVAVPCLEAGLHVLSEKPLAATISDARAIVDAANKHHRVLALMYQYRQRPAIRKARELIEAGAIGDWYYGVMHHGINRSQAYYDARAWRGTWAGEGGGVIVNQAPHPIDIMMHLVGAFPRRVTAVNGALRHRMQTEDLSTAILEYEHGAQIVMHADTIQLPTSEWWALHGDRGVLHVQDTRVTLQKLDPSLPDAIASSPPNTKPSLTRVTTEVFDVQGEDLKHLGMMQDFVDAIATGRQPLVGGEWALQCVELQCAIIASSQARCAIEFPPDADAYDALLNRLSESGA